MPGSTFVMSVAAPLVAAGLRLLLPPEVGAAADLVWLLGLVPVFLATRHLGWSGTLYGLAWAAAIVLLTSLAVPLRDGTPMDWTRAGAVVVILASCALGAGLQAQWLRAGPGGVEAGLSPASATRPAPGKTLPDGDAVSSMLDKLFAAARRRPPLAVAVFEIGDLEARRSVGGEAAVARAVAAAGDALRADSRAMDVVGRRGESRFLVLLPGADLRGGHLFSRRVFEALEEQPMPPEGRLRLDAGIAAFEEGIESPDELVRRAEQAVEAARGIGGGAIVLFRGGSRVSLADPGMMILEPDGRLREIHRTV
jgi:GGDEF domain-containing protein